jgi:hypothetical protein
MFGLRTEPAAVTFAIRACLYALIAFQIIAWTDVQIVTLLAAIAIPTKSGSSTEAIR